MALGWDTTPAACTASRALLAGRPVYLTEKGLPHRASWAAANPRYYVMLEDYVTRLTQFGVRVAPWAELEAAFKWTERARADLRCSGAPDRRA